MQVRTPPSAAATFWALLRAELIAYRRGARTLVWTALVPLCILALGELEVPQGLRHSNAPTLEIVALAITTGAFALGLYGYGSTLVNHRDRGIFQRLRCAPVPSWQLLGARLIVQLLGVAVQALVVFIAAGVAYGVTPGGNGVTLASAVIAVSGLAGLAIGQVVVALSGSASTATAVSRLLLLVLFLLEGVVVATQNWPVWLQQAAEWTPVRMSLNLLTDTLVRQRWDSIDRFDLLGLLVWTAVLGYIGLTRFRWESE